MVLGARVVELERDGSQILLTSPLVVEGLGAKHAEVMSAIFTEYRNEKRNGAKFGNVTIYLLIVKSALCS